MRKPPILSPANHPSLNPSRLTRENRSPREGARVIASARNRSIHHLVPSPLTKSGSELFCPSAQIINLRNRPQRASAPKDEISRAWRSTVGAPVFCDRGPRNFRLFEWAPKPSPLSSRFTKKSFFSASEAWVKTPFFVFARIRIHTRMPPMSTVIWAPSG